MAYKIRELVNTLENLFKDFDKEVLVGIPSDNSDNPVIKLVPLRVVQVGAMDQKALLIAEHRLLPEPEKSCETCLHCESDEIQTPIIPLPSTHKEVPVSDKILSDRLDMIMSLFDALEQAGGGPRYWSEAKNMTLEQLVETLSQNGIRFVYQPPKQKGR